MKIFLLLMLALLMSSCSKSATNNQWDEDRAKAFLAEQENSILDSKDGFTLRIEPQIIYVNNIPDALTMFLTNNSSESHLVHGGYKLEFYDGENWVHLNLRLAVFGRAEGFVKPGETFETRAWSLGEIEHILPGKYRIQHLGIYGHQPFSVFFILDPP